VLLGCHSRVVPAQPFPSGLAAAVAGPSVFVQLGPDTALGNGSKRRRGRCAPKVPDISFRPCPCCTTSPY